MGRGLAGKALYGYTNGIPATVGTDVKYVIDDMLNDRIYKSS
jgi:hypothetical protein